MNPPKIIMGMQGFVITFKGIVPEQLQGQDPELIKGWLLQQFTAAMPVLGSLKESTTEVVQLGIDGRPLPSGPKIAM